MNLNDAAPHELASPRSAVDAMSGEVPASNEPSFADALAPVVHASIAGDEGGPIRRKSSRSGGEILLRSTAEVNFSDVHAEIELTCSTAPHPPTRANTATEPLTTTLATTHTGDPSFVLLQLDAPPSLPVPKRAAEREYEAEEIFDTVAELAARYGTALDAENPAKSAGLTFGEAASRLEKFGPNRLTPPKAVPEWYKFLLCFTDPFMVLLAFAGALCFLAWGLGDQADSTNATLGGVLCIVVFLTCCMTYSQGRATSAVMGGFAKMMPQQCTVVREGKEQRVAAEDLVPGDLVRLGLGDRVPADVRLITSNDLKVEMSSLTGEPDAIACFVERQHDAPLEARNLAFNSALVMNGEGRGVVIRTGDNTMIGKIATLATGTAGTGPSSMEREVLHFVHIVACIAVATAIVFFIIGAGRTRTKEGIMAAFINGFIIVMVAFVPEGLPATVSSCLTITAQRLAEKSVFIKRADIVESLGTATVICSDKTGTLTQNRMTVENLWVNKHVQSTMAAVSRTVHNDRTPVVDHVMAMAVGRTLTIEGEQGVASVQRTASRRSVSSQKSVGVAGAAEALYGSFYGSFSAFKSMATAGNGLGRASWTKSSPYMRLVIAAGVCNRARFAYTSETAEAPASGVPGARKETKVLGDASDSALLRFVDRIIPIFELRSWAFPALFEIPFNSVNKWSLAVIRATPEGTAAASTGAPCHVSLIKGAPEIVLARCTHYLHNGVEKDIDEEFRHDHQSAYEQFGFMGERVLGFAFKNFNGPRDSAAYAKDDSLAPRNGMVFLGLMSLVDPPREGVAAAVGKCRAASIRVTMVTGDHPLTAEAIARKVGIITQPTRREIAAMDGVDEEEVPLSDPRIRAVVRAGHQIRDLSVAEWDTLLTKDEVVFARTTPQQKLEIVENYQRLGHVVSVTGDGVNDSPALKKANVGIAMGSAEASDVAREAADVVLMDDNFASIVSAIEEGRVLFDNLKKSIAYTIAHTVPELFPVVLNLWFSLPLPLPGLIILTIDLLTEQGPAISFAYEKAEDSVMARPPRKMGVDRLVSRQLIQYAYGTSGIASSLVCMLAYFLVFARAGVPLSKLWLSADSFWSAKAGDFDLGNGTVLSSSEQLRIYHQSVAAYYGTLVACQALHVWTCKTRLVSIFAHGLLSNALTAPGVAMALIICAFCIYVPGVQSIFFTALFPPELWACSLLYGVYIWTYTEGVKKACREHPHGWVARNLAW
jgi:sodium/potassium-transporting ATPase subunit alpha